MSTAKSSVLTSPRHGMGGAADIGFIPHCVSPGHPDTSAPLADGLPLPPSHPHSHPSTPHSHGGPDAGASAWEAVSGDAALAGTDDKSDPSGPAAVGGSAEAAAVSATEEDDEAFMAEFAAKTAVVREDKKKEEAIRKEAEATVKRSQAGGVVDQAVAAADHVEIDVSPPVRLFLSGRHARVLARRRGASVPARGRCMHACPLRRCRTSTKRRGR